MSSLDYYDKAPETVCKKMNRISGTIETPTNEHSCAEKCNADLGCAGFTHTNTNGNHKCNLFSNVDECQEFQKLSHDEWDQYTHAHWYAKNTDFYKKVKAAGPSPLETCRHEKSSIQIKMNQITEDNYLLDKEKSLLESQFNDVSSEKSNLQSRMEVLSSENSSLTTLYSSLQTEIGETKTELDKLSRQNSTTRTTFQNMTDENAKLNSKMQKVSKSNDKLQKNITNLKKQNRDLENDLKFLENKTQEDNSELHGLRAKNTDITNELYIVKTELEDFEGQIKFSSDEILKCENENDQMKIEYENLNNKVIDLLDKEQSWSDKVVLLETEKNAWEIYKMDLSSSYSSLAQENEHLRETCGPQVPTVKTLKDVSERLKTTDQVGINTKEACDAILKDKLGKVEKYPKGFVHPLQTLVDGEGNPTDGAGYISVNYIHNGKPDINAPVNYKKGHWHPSGCAHDHQGRFTFNVYDRSHPNQMYSDDTGAPQNGCDAKWSQCIFK